MFVPLKDDNPLKLIRFQFVSAVFIAINVIVFLITGPMRGDEALMITAVGFGVVPSELLDVGRVAAGQLNPIAEPFTLVTYMFLHAGWIHLLSNMAFLWVFSDNVEDVFGHLGFGLFYILCGVAAALVHVAMQPNSHEPLIGASGAVSGVLAAYLLMFPHARIWIFLFVPLPFRIPAWVVLGGWIILQFFMLAQENPEAQQVAWWAHIGGFCMGLVYTLILRSPLLLRRPAA